MSLLRQYISACKCWDRREEMPAKAVRLRRHFASQGLTHFGIAPDVREEQRSERIERLPAPIAQALSARRQPFSHSIISDEATVDCWHPLLSDAAGIPSARQEMPVNSSLKKTCEKTVEGV